MRCQLWNNLLEDIQANCMRDVNVFRFIKYCLFSLSVQVLFLYRVAHLLDSRLGVIGGYLAFAISWLAQLISGCHINPKSIISGGVFLPHAVGIIIGEGCVLEKGVSIYQNVTLGRKNGLNTGYPTLKSGCAVYSGAVIIGAITVGRDAIVGANSFVSKDVIDGSVVAGAPARVIQSV